MSNTSQAADPAGISLWPLGALRSIAPMFAVLLGCTAAPTPTPLPYPAPATSDASRPSTATPGPASDIRDAGQDPTPETSIAPADKQATLIMKVVRDHASGLRRCYESALRSSPKRPGAPEKVEWTIGEDGSVSDVEVSIPDAPELESCLKREILGWRFAPPVSGRFTVRYPLH